ncbi:hypothetical protein BpHYR1_051767 [Brachionus plicatilis]|uniref:Uncharacterized protein n=1 Tax=Brachionus plicatilis TaxID=10195 RepID=A0A3M7R6J6_BRAPC|nr:hypothetical protein BpHYR1_051767 [Brachionus plicatilis]
MELQFHKYFSGHKYCTLSIIYIFFLPITGSTFLLFYVLSAPQQWPVTWKEKNPISLVKCTRTVIGIDKTTTRLIQAH